MLIEPSAIVHDFVVDVQAAAAEAMALHLIEFVSHFSNVKPETIAAALDHGYDVDLDEYVAPNQPIGFDHQRVSDAFRNRESILRLNKDKLSHHIWEADENNEIFSLFGRSARDEKRDSSRRTRASAIVQRAMRDCRSYRQAEKATTAEPTCFITIPSPLFVAQEILSDPRALPSKVYAASALQEWVREQLECAVGGSLDLSYAAVSEALSLINNRWKTSKPVVAHRKQNGATTLFLCNMFAIRGFMALRVDLQELRRAFKGAQSVERFFYECMIGQPQAEGAAEFLVNPHFVDLPDIGHVMNLIDGLPIPLEGADVIFHGGLRLSNDLSLVAGLSGTFGAGKTMFGLSLAAALAPLGCRTLFLSCEESAADLQTRLLEAAPPSLFRTAPLFRILSSREFRRARPAPHSKDPIGSATLPWFIARQLEIELADERMDLTKVDPAGALGALLEDAVMTADVFRTDSRDDAERPRFARPIIIVDGLHQLFELPESQKGIEASLRGLVERCRKLGAIFVFSFSSEFQPLKRLEYLCDLIIELGREGFEKPAESPRRYFQLLKARRQPASIGAHVFHLTGGAGFRMKPSANARVQASKSELWWDPDLRTQLYLSEEPPQGFLDHSSNLPIRNSLPIRNHSQVLVVGKGSSGKAGFGLYLLHRRWFDSRMFPDDYEREQLSMLEERRDLANSVTLASQRRKAVHQARLPVWSDAPYLETRVLVVSFLYQGSYYDELTSRISSKRRGKPNRKLTRMVLIGETSLPPYTPLPDRLRTDTIELYPGMLSVEDFIAKVDKKLATAEGLGLPYTGVLIDGLHNVFVQFPALEAESSFWGMFYNILRRRRLSVVTTHTEFGLTGAVEGESGRRERDQTMMLYNFEQAQRKIAPLLSALVSGADYVFELSTYHEGRAIRHRLTPRGSVGYEVGDVAFLWDKGRLRLDGTISTTF